MVCFLCVLEVFKKFSFEVIIGWGDGYKFFHFFGPRGVHSQSDCYWEEGVLSFRIIFDKLLESWKFYSSEVVLVAFDLFIEKMSLLSPFRHQNYKHN